MAENIYSRLYDLAEQNMTDEAPEPLHPKKVTMFYTESDPFETDILHLMKVDATNAEFVCMAFIAIFGRLIDDNAYEAWSKSFSLPKEQFRKKVIVNLTSSEEIRVINKKIYNNIYAEKGTSSDIFTKPNPLINTAVKVYRKMPESVKSVIRKARGIRK